MSIRHITEANEEIRCLLRRKWEENAYVLIDAESYGFEGEHISAWTIHDKGEVKAVLYLYYDGLQIVEDSPLDNQALGEVADLVEELRPQMISANAVLIGRLNERLAGYSATIGYMMKADGSQTRDPDVFEAPTSAYKEIAELICSDDKIGQHYTVDGLTAQLLERAELQGCRSFIMRLDGKVIAHMATYAESADLAVLGGLISKSDSGVRGAGGRVLSTIAADAIERGKVPVLYCYIESLWPWYKKRGWEIISEVGKLEPIRACVVGSKEI